MTVRRALRPASRMLAAAIGLAIVLHDRPALLVCGGLYAVITSLEIVELFHRRTA